MGHTIRQPALGRLTMDWTHLLMLAEVVSKTPGPRVSDTWQLLVSQRSAKWSLVSLKQEKVSCPGRCQGHEWEMRASQTAGNRQGEAELKRSNLHHSMFMKSFSRYWIPRGLERGTRSFCPQEISSLVWCHRHKYVPKKKKEKVELGKFWRQEIPKDV